MVTNTNTKALAKHSQNTLSISADKMNLLSRIRVSSEYFALLSHSLSLSLTLAHSLRTIRRFRHLVFFSGHLGTHKHPLVGTNECLKHPERVPRKHSSKHSNKSITSQRIRVSNEYFALISHSLSPSLTPAHSLRTIRRFRHFVFFSECALGMLCSE